jgi:phospholipase/carboxylesterase
VRIPGDAQNIMYHDWTLRIQPANDQAARLLLLIHGLTGDENSMWVFARGLSTTYWIVAPRAPHLAILGGYSWCPQLDKKMGRGNIDEYRPVVDDLLTLVDSYASENNIESNHIDIIGFSQGAVMANAIALLHPEKIDRVGVLAGFVPSDIESFVWQRVLTGKLFFVAHGSRDEMVNIEYARQSVELLQAAGAQVTFCEDDIEHKISARCHRAMVEFFA